MSLRRPCLAPSCGRLTEMTRCPEHRRAKERARGSKAERGYGPAYQCARRELLATAEVCTWCGSPAGPDSIAADRAQARLVFDTARRMVGLDPELASACRVTRDTIEHTATGSIYRVLSSEAFTKEGLSPTLVIADELVAAVIAYDRARAGREVFPRVELILL